MTTSRKTKIVLGVLLILVPVAVYYFIGQIRPVIAKELEKSIEVSEKPTKLPPDIENYYSYIPVKNVNVVTAINGDYDGDRDIDIAIIVIDKSQNNYEENFVILYIWENDGKGNFQLKQRAP